MKSLKIKLCSIIAFAVIFAVAVGTVLGITAARAERSVTISGSSIFYTSGGAEVWAHQVNGTDEEGQEQTSYYTMFVLKNESASVNYRHDLAYNWVYNAGEKPEKGENNEMTTPALVEGHGWLNAEIGFEPVDGKLNFKKFIMTFESKEYTQTKDEITKNYIIFYTLEESTKVGVVITDDAEEELKENATALDYDNIIITLSKGENGGEYGVLVKSGDNEVTGKFVNVGGTYAKYSSSSSSPLVPISFKAEFENKNSSDNSARMALYNLNGQSFSLSGTRDSDGHRTGGTVTDTTAPVLCLDKALTYVGYGKEISFDFYSVDVLTSSPSSETSYFMLTREQAEDGEFDANNYSDENLFRKISASDDQMMIPHVKHYNPKTSDFGDNTKFGKDLEAKALIKVCLKLTDTTSSGGVSDYVMLDWLVDDAYLAEINKNKYIAVATDTKGVTYAYTNDTEETSDTSDDGWQELVDKYQAEVTKAAKDLKAGSKNYFYLPSAEKLLSDNATRYEDMTFAIYYNNGSQQQQSNKKYNNLSINIDKAGRYIFTLFANDTASNDMYYFKEGKKVEFKTSDIWNMYAEEAESDFAGTKKYLPWFTFDVEASEISIETPKEQDTAYVGSTYSPDSFEINGVSYKTEYKLYLFNNDAYYNDTGSALTYEQFMEQKDELLNDGVNRKWFTYIYATSELTEGTEEYKLYNDYAWNNSSVSFVPQDENAFYLIECRATSTEGGTQEAVAYMGIAAAPKVESIKGEDTWVQDNIVSIVLLCIAGVSLIGIILLLVIKPKDKDLDEIEESAENGKKKKSKK